MDNPEQKLISLSQAAKQYGLTADYLRQLAIKGRLKAYKIGNSWVTTPDDVEAYIRSRQKVGVFKDKLTTDSERLDSKIIPNPGIDNNTKT